MHLFTTFLMNAHYGPGTVPGTGDPAVNSCKVLALVELTFPSQETVNKDIMGQKDVIPAKEKNETG